MSWIISQALMNLLCSQEQAEEFSVDICLDGEQSVPLSGNPTPQAYCAPDKMTKFSRLSRFGMTYKPLTETRGEELLTLYLADFHAKTSQSQETGQVLTESAQACGERWHGLLARFDHDMCLWKTVQCSLLEDLNESLQTLPQWGMTVGGELYLRHPLVRPIKENESGLWRMPDTGAGGTSGLLKQGITHRANGQPIQVRLVDQVNNPKMWPTPSTRDHKGGYIGGRIRNGKVSWDTLDVAVQHTDNQSKDGGQLNPKWVEWLIGWPLGWTDLKPLEMDRFQQWQQEHFKFSLNEAV
jgi:hypothetical protein